MTRRNAYAAPHWAASQKVGDVATKATLLVLANYADENYSCYPSQQRIADETEQSVSTVYRQIKRLESLGLIRRERRSDGKGHRLSDRFYLDLDQQADVSLPVNLTDGPSGHLVTGGLEGPTGQTGPSLPVTGDRGTPRELLEEDSLRSSSPPTLVPVGSTRTRDVVWESLLTVCGVDPFASITRSARGAYNRAVADLRDAGAEPDEVLRRAAIFRATWPDVRMTPTALARRWHEVEQIVPTGPAHRLRQAAEREELAARMARLDAQEAVR